MFLGKLLGASVGYYLFNFPGAVVGLICGYLYDRRRLINAQNHVLEQSLSPEKTERVRQSFFSATFSVMGHVAKSDGAVKPAQIAQAEHIMEQMRLDAQLRASAIGLFNTGKHSDFDLDKQVKRFRDECASSTSLYRVFLEIQIQVALADGAMAREEEAILLHVAKVLGFSESLFRQLELLVRVSLGLGDNHNHRYGQYQRAGGKQHSTQTPSNQSSLAAYQILGVSEDDNAATVKRAYRKLMNQHHPDKLVSKGLPEEMLRVATDKTQEIQKAYEQIKQAKGWR